VTVKKGRIAIKAAGGQRFYVDASDAKVVRQFRWYVDNGYVARSVYQGEKKYKLLLHRWMLNAPDDRFVEFRDGDPLNCTRRNLRITKSISKSHKRPDAKSKYKGVTKKGKRWVASIRIDGVLHHLGYFDRDRDAAKAYDDAATEAHGKYAKTNEALGLFKARK